MGIVQTLRYFLFLVRFPATVDQWNASNYCERSNSYTDNQHCGIIAIRIFADKHRPNVFF